MHVVVEKLIKEWLPGPQYTRDLHTRAHMMMAQSEST
eukprot:COSAG06_NODE_63584_length_262_cov_0.552147_1_plen_36_part_10